MSGEDKKQEGEEPVAPRGMTYEDARKAAGAPELITPEGYFAATGKPITGANWLDTSGDLPDLRGGFRASLGVSLDDYPKSNESSDEYLAKLRSEGYVPEHFGQNDAEALGRYNRRLAVLRESDADYFTTQKGGHNTLWVKPKADSKQEE